MHLKAYDWGPPPIDCQTCNHLLDAYKQSVTFFQRAVQKGLGAVGDDSRLSGAEAERLAQMCIDASDALLAHCREDHSADRHVPS
jgi:hypothetical protein